MERFTILRIDEPMYGCEELPEDAPLKDIVTLRGEDGAEKIVYIEDELLYARNLNEGDAVCYDEENGLQKA